MAYHTPKNQRNFSHFFVLVYKIGPIQFSSIHEGDKLIKIKIIPNIFLTTFKMNKCQRVYLTLKKKKKSMIFGAENSFLKKTLLGSACN